MLKLYHDQLIKEFNRRKLKVNRGNSIFTAPTVSTADDWGNVYVVFVKDGWIGQTYSGTWDDYSFYEMRRIGVALDAIEKLKAKLKGLKSEKEPSKEKIAAQEKMIANYREEIDNDFDDLGIDEFTSSAALAAHLKAGRYEILFKGDSYIGIDVRFFKQIKGKLGL